MSQTCDAAGPNRLDAAAVLQLDESLQIPHHGVGKFVHGESQLVTRFPSNVRLLNG